MKEYSKRLVEVDEILMHLSKSEYEKIPKEILQNIKENKDKNYLWKFDKSKKLGEQDINRDTIALLAYINMNYLLDEKQKSFMKTIYQINEQNKRKENSTTNMKSDFNELFKKNRPINREVNDTEIKQENTLIKKEESLFHKIINKIKQLFKR